MAYLSQMFSGRNATDLKTAVDAFFTANPTVRIYNVAVLARDQVGVLGREYVVSMIYDLDGAALSDPYEFILYTGNSADAIGTNVSDYITTNPTYFVMGIWIDDTGKKRRLDDLTGVIIVNPDADEGKANWLGTQDGVADNVKTLVRVAGNTTIADTTRYTIQVNGGITTDLPASPANGQTHEIRNKGGGAAGTIDGNGNNIEGAATLALNDGDAVTLVFDDTANDWTIF